MTREELVISGSDSFSRACAPSYRFCTGISSPVLSLWGFPSRLFFTWLMQYEPKRDLISSPFESSGFPSRSFITWQPHKLNLCSLREKDLIIITNSLVYYLCYHIQCYGKEPSWQKCTHLYTARNKSYNLRSETHHVTVRVNNDNNNYAPLCKEACKLTHLSIQCCHITWQKNERLENWS